MSQDMNEFCVMLGVLVLLFILIEIIIKTMSRKLSGWNELAAVFPTPDCMPEINFFQALSGASRPNFFSGKNSGFSIGFMDSRNDSISTSRVSAYNFRALFLRSSVNGSLTKDINKGLWRF